MLLQIRIQLLILLMLTAFIQVNSPLTPDLIQVNSPLTPDFLILYYFEYLLSHLSYENTYLVNYLILTCSIRTFVGIHLVGIGHHSNDEERTTSEIPMLFCCALDCRVIALLLIYSIIPLYLTDTL